jgi:hypothetical protein
LVTFTATTTDVQGEENVTPNVPRVELREVIEKLAEPLPDIVCEDGVTFKLLTVEVVIVFVPVMPVTLIVTLPVPPPFFFMEKDDGVPVSVQLAPVPVIGGPAVPLPLLPQSAVLL